MRKHTVWRAGLLAALLALPTGRALAQPVGLAGDYSPPAVQLPFPLYSTRPENGGFFFTGGYAMYQMTNPIKDQQIAYRGFIISNQNFIDPNTGTIAPVTIPTTGATTFQGEFVGSRALALDTQQVSGPSTYQPGFTVEGGWKFHDGSALTVSWLWVASAQYRADATLINTPIQALGNDQQDSFLTSFVYNFPAEYSGPAAKITTLSSAVAGELVPATGAVYGIWNGASVMTELFLQRFEQIEATYRKPFYETDCYRASALIGPRFLWVWENYRWTTTDLDVNGNGQPNWSAVYDNIVSNRMYGGHVGLCQEWYVGRGLALMLDVQGALFLDVVRERASYQLAAKEQPPQNKRSITQWTAVPEVQATPSVMWYPIEGIQLQFAWDFFALFNTVGSPNPVSFDYSGLDPKWERVDRFFNGLQAKIAFVF
jgi:hypothetical protein